MNRYGDRDVVALGDYYTQHVSAMTIEGLHSKSDIAAELAHRDLRIHDLEDKLTAAANRSDAYHARAISAESKLQAETKRADDMMHRGDSWREMCDELEARLKAVAGKLRTLAIGMVGARMAHVEEDYAEAYHLLYSAATALSDDPYEPWKALDALAAGAIERRDGQTFVNLPVVERLEKNGG